MSIATPWIAAHRGGANIYPEHSLEGYQASVNADFLPEIDLQRLSDGKFAVCHDPTTGRTMTGTNVAVSSLTSAQFKARNVKNPIPGGEYGTPLTFDDVLNLFGGQPLLIEAKVATDASAIISILNSRGLSGSVILASFDFNTASLIADAGYTSMFLFQGTPSATAAQVKAAGITYAGISRGTSQTTYNSFLNAGLKMAVWTIEDPIAYQYDLNRDAVGFITDDPLYITGRDAKLSSDPFDTRFAYPGWQEGVTSADIADENTGRLWSFAGAARGSIGVARNPVSARTRSLTQTWAGIFNADFNIRATFEYGSDYASDSRWMGMFVGCGKGKAVTGPDAVWRDESSPIVYQQYGYGVLWRRNGQMAIYRNDSGEPVLLGSAYAPPLSSYGKRSVEFKRTGNTFTATDLGSGDSLVVSSGTYGGDQFLALAANGTNGTVSGVTVRR